MIYLAHDSFRVPLPGFEFEWGNRMLRILPFDLERGEIVFEGATGLA